MFMSDGADEMINAARAVWLTVLWLLCYWHAQKNMRENLKDHVAILELRPQVHGNLLDPHLSWSTPVFQAGWVALEDHYYATPEYLDHAREKHRQRQSGWFVVQSPPGVPCVTPVEARARWLKLVTQHKLHGIREFLKDVLPCMDTQWAQSREQLGGRGMQPAPWMWLEAQVMLHKEVFVYDCDAILFHYGVTSRNWGANGRPICDPPPPSGLLRLASGRRPCPPSMKAAVSCGCSSHPSSAFTVSRWSFARVPHTPPLEFVTALC